MFFISHAEQIFNDDLKRIFPHQSNRPGEYLVQGVLNENGDVFDWVGISPISHDHEKKLAGTVPRRHKNTVQINGVLKIAVHPEHMAVLYWSPESYLSNNKMSHLEWPERNFIRQDSWHTASCIRAAVLSPDKGIRLHDEHYALVRVNRLGTILSVINEEPLLGSGIQAISKADINHGTPQDSSFLIYVVTKNGQTRPIWYPVDIRQFDAI